MPKIQQAFPVGSGDPTWKFDFKQGRLYTSAFQRVPMKQGMVNWHPLATIWHPLEGPDRFSRFFQLDFEKLGDDKIIS